MAALNSGSPPQINESFGAVVRVRARGALEGLIRLSDDENVATRTVTANLLGHLALDSNHSFPDLELAVPVLINLAQDDNADVRMQAVKSLGWIGAPKAVTAIPVLIMRLKDVDANVRIQSIYALARFGSYAEVALDDIRANINDPSVGVRSAALTAIRQISDTPIVSDP